MGENKCCAGCSVFVHFPCGIPAINIDSDVPLRILRNAASIENKLLSPKCTFEKKKKREKASPKSKLGTISHDRINNFIEFIWIFISTEYN